MDTNQQYEAVKLASFEHNGEKKWNRTFLGNLKPNADGNGFRLYVPEGIAVFGEILIQPKQDRQEEA